MTHALWSITYTGLALTILVLVTFIVLALMWPHNTRHEYRVILVPEDRGEAVVRLPGAYKTLPEASLALRRGIRAGYPGGYIVELNEEHTNV